MDFSNVPMNGELSSNGFSILCGGCDQFINMKFDVGLSTKESMRDKMPDGSSTSFQYVIGISNVTDMSQLAKAIFDGVKAIDGSAYTITSDQAEIVMLDFRHNVNLMKMGDEYFVTKNYEPSLCVCNYLIKEVETGEDYPTPLTIHHGTKSNQAINFYINDMHTKALDIDNAKVDTRKKAISAIGMVDNAINYALGEATYMGAYLQRLDYTELNVTSQNENTQSAESTIRDADMAKEMTEYTKQNVIMQASQSMLAQANQNLSSVLSLLQ